MGKWMTDKESLHCIRWYKVIPNGAKDQWWKRPHLIFSIFILVVFFSSWLFALHLCVSALGHHERPIPVGLPWPVPLHSIYRPCPHTIRFHYADQVQGSGKGGEKQVVWATEYTDKDLTCCLCCSSFMRLMYITREGLKVWEYLYAHARISVCIFCQRVVKT